LRRRKVLEKFGRRKFSVKIKLAVFRWLLVVVCIDVWGRRAAAGLRLPKAEEEEARKPVPDF
jgi:hypothetical protein